jgi:hypothetical protein
VVRKKLAWASIVRDARGLLQLPPAQEDDAKKKFAEAVNAVRRGWKHLLLPQEAQPGSPNAARGFDLEPVALTNRASNPDPLTQLVWKKCEADGLIVSQLGVLDNDVGKVWQPDQPHVPVRQLRDWFAQFPYLSKLRDPQVLAKAISEALAQGADTKYAIADRFDDGRSSYWTSTRSRASCARAASGHAAAAAPPSSVKNWRRSTSSMGSPLCQLTAGSGCPGSARRSLG